MRASSSATNARLPSCRPPHVQGAATPPSQLLSRRTDSAASNSTVTSRQKQRHQQLGWVKQRKRASLRRCEQGAAGCLACCAARAAPPTGLHAPRPLPAAGQAHVEPQGPEAR